ALALLADPVRVQVVIPRPEVEGLADQERRRLHRAGPHAPVLLAVPRVERDHEPARARLVLAARELVHVRLVDDAVRDRRRRGRAVLEVLRPDDLPGARVERVEAALLLRDVDLAVRDRGRELDVRVRLQLPEAVEGRAEAVPVRRQVRALHVIAVGRPLHLVQAPGLRLLAVLLLLWGGGGGRAQRRRDLPGGRADDVTWALLVPGPAAEGGPCAER